MNSWANYNELLFTHSMVLPSSWAKVRPNLATLPCRPPPPHPFVIINLTPSKVLRIGLFIFSFYLSSFRFFSFFSQTLPLILKRKMADAFFFSRNYIFSKVWNLKPYFLCFQAQRKKRLTQIYLFFFLLLLPDFPLATSLFLKKKEK